MSITWSCRLDMVATEMFIHLRTDLVCNREEMRDRGIPRTTLNADAETTYARSNANHNVNGGGTWKAGFKAVDCTQGLSLRPCSGCTGRINIDFEVSVEWMSTWICWPC